jgi:hypothetical protein
MGESEYYKTRQFKNTPLLRAWWLPAAVQGLRMFQGLLCRNLVALNG